MARRARPLLSVLIAGASIALAAAGLNAGGAAQAAPRTKPTKVVIIVVDALSKEIVDKYDMANVKKLMADYVDTPNGYLGHTGSVTVVTHNVITSGLLPKHTGWTTEGYRDVDNILPDAKPTNAGDNLFISSDWGKDQIYAVQNYYGYPKLADYLSQTGTVATISPKVYAAYAYSGDASDIVITFGSANCPEPSTGAEDGHIYGSLRGPTGVGVPSYITGATCGGRYYVERNKVYDTGKLPAVMYPTSDNRYVVGDNDEHLGGDIWATDAALDVMDHEDWSGIFLTLPGVDKAAHMWGGVNDPGPTGLDGVELTHVEFAARTADEQVGRIMDKLEADGELDNTLVVLTADHGSVAVHTPPNGTETDPHFHGTVCNVAECGFNNWYYGDVENDAYLTPQASLQPLVATDNVGFSYNDSGIQTWLIDQSPAKKNEAAAIMANMPDVTAVWRNDGDHFTRVSPIRYDLMTTKAERKWFDQHAQELVDTQAAPYGPDLVATLADNTTYSVAGDHGGIQRAAQQIPIVFAGAGLGSRDVMAPVRSVDIMPTILKAMGITPTAAMDGVAYPLPK
ncbi:alkaline phosphatase family protein [Nocardioides agariphilus]|jgi:hypothetical protein|uniref:Alkaline phosphatase family protein n=1 Tax=Nocardioides agariphilus TaxID=433664 RepID=A0A930YM42_9ACTN|nr:alkaline phosphatase family protein [Nocardioides agariphilus]MBF4767714.1 alkaline phosphatase family protein [Nocardioides agariphilus]